jgi:hypothetical protein
MTSKVYEAICSITDELSKIGIAKDRKNTQQGYSFRGIDDVYMALSPLLAKYKLCILPKVVDREVVEKATKAGGVLFYTVLRVEFEFVSAEDASKHTVITVGEAMDSGDKSSNKAQSAAYKYACLQAFCIPTEGDNDADATTHEVKVRSAFENPAMRQLFIDNTAISFDKAETVEKLNELVTLAKTKKQEMEVSGDPEDAAAAERLSEAYRSRLKTLKAVKPATVEDAVTSQLDGVLGNDQLPA